MAKHVLSVLFFFTSLFIFGQTTHLQNGISKIIKDKDLTLGVAIYDTSSGDSFTTNGDRRFPMQSVFKFHVALSVLDKVDKGELNLSDSIFISGERMRNNLWSPIRDLYPNGNIYLSLSEIIKHTVSQSDNIGCDILIEVVGGTKVVDLYIKKVGIKEVNITYNEEQMQALWHRQFENWTTPKEAISLLKLFYEERLLSKDTHAFLHQTMTETSTGSIKKRLPKNSVVAHKTGSSGYNSDGICAAVNDIGIMELPSGNKILYAIFITNSTESEVVNYNIISDIGKLLYHNF